MFLFRTSQLLGPESGNSIGRHAPIATGRKADAADLGTVGEAAALELLGEEAAAEDAEPLGDGGFVIIADRFRLSLIGILMEGVKR